MNQATFYATITGLLTRASDNDPGNTAAPSTSTPAITGPGRTQTTATSPNPRGGIDASPYVRETDAALGGRADPPHLPRGRHKGLIRNKSLCENS
ncbi:MAG: hypothetical protein ABSF03_06795 [Streptosporangiaceae bacterium]|jgi:hypothetical protein